MKANERIKGKFYRNFLADANETFGGHLCRLLFPAQIQVEILIVLYPNNTRVITDNAHIESCNGSFREDRLNTNWFMFLKDTKEKLERWRNDTKEYRPHSAITTLLPAEFT